MTTLLTTHDVAAIVGAHGLPEVLRRMEAAISADFRRWNDFDKVPRLASHSSVGVIELMPVADAEHYAFKYVNGHPGNARHGLPTVMAFGVIADVATGLPRLLGELTLTTAMRTAATSVMAARALARPDARTMALIGNGAQSEFQAIAFARGLAIRTLHLYDVDAAATAKLMRNLRGQPDLEVIPCASVAEAVRGADIVTTVTADKRRAAVLLPEMIEPGMHLNAVGGDCPGKTEVHPEVLRRADVFVEYEPQSRIEGDVQQMAADFPVTELWRVLTGTAPGRANADAVTMFDSVGFALEDYAALRLVGELAAGLGRGQQVDLIPTLRDPRDLYAELLPAPAPAQRQLRRA
ncbi:MAG: ornithine cyclodeaminase [Burkholderiales bacterium]|nr:ornithine cyclodeaminase [Burkholderiales bacterium]MDE1929015.1 ornithine cyclodeaminase [Burkholderiales bacterium]MDE2159634.1 ornithine cyclodeaminase [Burkholderiales bacterium]MDE2504874.1 ornithine cyclodeaminase [Burkholderiales bacterium]